MKKSAEEQCEGFNSKFPIGTPVMLRKDGEECFTNTVTRSTAQMLGRQAVIWLEGVSGSYLLERVIPIEQSNTDKAVREIAKELARRDKAQFTDATTMPSVEYYELKARELMSLVVPYVRPYLAKSMGGGWQDISTAPKDGTEILAASTGTGAMIHIVFWHEIGAWHNGEGVFDNGYITHWQPLPQPPEGV